MADINKMTNQERAKKIMDNVRNRVGTKKEMMISPMDWTMLRKIADSTSDGNQANSENANCAIFDVSVPKGTFCDLYKKQCIGGLCSVTPIPEKCKHLIKQNAP